MSSYPHQVIRASAGTGKTYTLSNHYLDLLRRHAQPQDILATTFTRKAAGEILERVLLRLAHAAATSDGANELSKALGPPGLSQHQAQQLLALLCRSLHRVSISTIDAFFHRLAQMFRHELGIPPNPALVDDRDSRVELIRLRAIEAVLADDDLQTLIGLLRRLHHDSAKRSVTEAIDQIVQDLYQTYLQAPDLQTWSQLQPVGQELDEPLLTQAITDFAQLAEHLPKTKAGSVNKTWAKAHKTALDTAWKRDWDAFVDSGLIKKILVGENAYSKITISQAWQDTSRPLIDHAAWYLVDRVGQETIATYELLHRFDHHFTRLRQAHRMMLFADLPRILASDLPRMGDDLLTQIYFRLDARVAHLLLDEFQDTSVLQWDILNPLAQEVAATVDGSRTFFCVGDLKQSIYGWRGGCAEIFNLIQAQLHLEPQAQKSLSHSYRSSPIVLQAVNQLFTNLADRQAICEKEIQPTVQRWQAAFEPHKPAAKNQNLPGYVQLLATAGNPPLPRGAANESTNQPINELTTLDSSPASDSPDDDSESSPLSNDPHLDYVAKQVKQIARRCPGRSVGILVFTNRSVRSLIFRLRREGVDASGEGGNPLTDEPAVLAMLAALTLADHPGDQIARFHLLTSPLATRLGLTSSHPQAIARWANQVRRDLLAQGYADLLTQWTRLVAPDCDSRGLTRLMQLVELADRYQQDATLRPGDFVQFVRSSDVEEPSPAPVRVMTVHKAKGLEFDVVVLPELNRDIGHIRPSAALIHQPSPAEPIDAVFRYANQTIRALSPQLQEAYAQEQDRRTQDDLCALYVAMTRARYALHLMLKPLIKPNSKSAMVASLLREVFIPQDVDENPAGGQTLYTLGQPDWHQQLPQPTTPTHPPATPTATASASPLSALQQPSASPRRSWRLASPSSLHRASRVRVDDLLSPQTSPARLRGSILHAFFQTIHWLDHPSSPLPDDAQLLALARSLAPQSDPTWLQQLIRQFHDLLAKPTLRAALTHPHDPAVTLWREQPFVLRLDHQLVRGIFDRVVLLGPADQPHHAHLLDFKTDHLAPDRSNLDLLQQTYAPQMQMYRAALSQMLRLPPQNIRASLLFVGADLCLDIPITAENSKL